MILNPDSTAAASKDIQVVRARQQYERNEASPNVSTAYPSVEEEEEGNEHDRLLGEGQGQQVVFPGPSQSLGPPPAFAPYEAEWFEVGYGEVVSHDEHLNTDGEALYRFLLTQANAKPPTYRIHCRGSHNETRYRWVTSYDNSSNSSNSSHQHHNHHHHHNHQNGSSTRTETYTERITDFDFYIDITPSFNPSQLLELPTPVNSKLRTNGIDTDGNNDSENNGPTHWSIADNEPAYRGKMVREIEIPESYNQDFSLDTNHITTTKRRTTRREHKEYDKAVEQRTLKGYPPWLPPSAAHNWNLGTGPNNALLSPNSTVLKSSKTLRQWADEYCASPKLLKEFTYTKSIYGWNMASLTTAIRATIALAPYHGDIEVSFRPINSKIHVRSSNKLSRALSNKWIKFLLIILFIYPFVWLYKRFHKKGGGKWEVCGGAYALKKWVPVEGVGRRGGGSSNSDSNADIDLPSYSEITGPSSSSGPSTSSYANTNTNTNPISISTSASTTTDINSRLITTPEGTYKLIGQHEGEWFRQWEPVILRAVRTRYQSITPLSSITHGEYGGYSGPGTGLEGYGDTISPIHSLPGTMLDNGFGHGHLHGHGHGHRHGHGHLGGPFPFGPSSSSNSGSGGIYLA